ncbi:MAG: hypothetical protein CMG46_02495 [Candidatus Marinimicrobia bacterium]|nr:hypothetical protein [Candidatus Neomarinimicrobiota bacterium]|tara:strand:- start:716 stop:2143 length:1428 start_codon:yes stop_codon:yes gene_type:complete
MHKLSRDGFIIIKKEIDEHVLDQVKEELTVKPFTMNDYSNNIKHFKLYTESDKKIYVPRFYGIEKMKNYIDIFNDELIQSINTPFKGGLRNEQLPIYKVIMNQLQSNGGGIISLKCGGGKTVLSLYIVSTLKVKTLVVVHKDFLMTQWYDRITEFIPNAKIGKIQQNTIDIENKDIVLAMVQSLSMKEYNSNIFENFGLVIFDECHHLGAEVFSKAMPKVASKYMLGLSATPNRKDGLKRVFEWYIGPIVYTSKDNQDEGVTVKIIKYNIDDEKYNKVHNTTIRVGNTFQSRPCCPRMINNICEYEPRNKLILSYIKQTYNEGRNVLLLSDRREHLKYIYENLLKENILSGYYVGGMKPSELRNSQTMSIILGTYSMASEGMDIPKLNTIILSTPKSDITQSIGRILREKKNIRKFNPLIIDINDEFSLFKNQSIKRMKYYKKSKYNIYIYDKDGNELPNVNIKKKTINTDICLL